MKNEHGLPCPFPWKKVPKYAQWMATESNGDTYAYEEKPIVMAQVWVHPYPKYGWKCKKIGKTAKPEDFTQCLWERPKIDEP